MKYKVTKEQQIKELEDRVPPILNVNAVIVKEGKYLVGHRNTEPKKGLWQFGGGRMKFTETPQEAAERILAVEFPGVVARLKKLITATSTIGDDPRANGVTLYYLFEYETGEPKPNSKNSDFRWMTKDEFLASEHVSWFSKSIVDEIDVAIRTMNTSEDELLVEVDEDNKEIGTIVKRVAHANPKKYHRAAHIMIFNSKGEVILQQRSWNKSIGPGIWDMPGGHQAAGQTIEQCAVAELSEELGVTPELKLKEIGLYQSEKQSEYYYLYFGISDGPYGFDRNEVEAIKSFDCEDLLTGRYDKEFEIFPHVKKYTEKLREIWEPLRKNS